MLRTALAVMALSLLCVLSVTSSASAKTYRSTSVAAPAYPASQLAMSVKGKPRSGGIVTLRVSGSNASRDNGDGLAFDYTLDVYVMDRSVYPSCARSQREANNRLANLPGKVEHIGLGLSEGASGPFSTTIKYQTEGFRRLMFCAYSTYVVDDAAMGSLKHDLLKKKKKRKRRS